MTSQLVIFRAFFLVPDPKSEKKSCKSTNKKNLALSILKHDIVSPLDMTSCDKSLYLFTLKLILFLIDFEMKTMHL